MSRAQRVFGMLKMSAFMFRLKQKFTMPGRGNKKKTAAMCLRLGVPSTLIRHQAVTFQKRFFKAEDFENAALC